MNMFANLRPNQLGAISAMIAVFFFSVNDGAIKFLSGGYALHEVVLIRSVIGLVILLVLIAPLTDGFAIFKTKRLGMHLIRGFCVVMANMTFFLGLAAMPLADAVAIFFISPLIITVFSVVFWPTALGGGHCRPDWRCDHDAPRHRVVPICVVIAGCRGHGLCRIAHADAAYWAHGECGDNGSLHPDCVYRGLCDYRFGRWRWPLW